MQSPGASNLSRTQAVFARALAWLSRFNGFEWAAIPSMGESWHNNHHAFPASALHGLYPGQFDIGFQFVRLLERAGLASDIQTPADLPPRAGLSCIDQRSQRHALG